MADQKFVDMIKRSVREFNEYKKNNPKEIIDLTNAPLCRLCLTGINLNNVNLKEADLSECNLYMAKFRKAKVLLTNFWKSDLTAADFREAKYTETAIFFEAIRTAISFD